MGEFISNQLDKEYQAETVKYLSKKLIEHKENKNYFYLMKIIKEINGLINGLSYQNILKMNF